MNAQRIAVTTLVALVSVTGCATRERTGSAAGEVGSATEAVSVVVENDNFSDVNVYAVRGAERVRLGTVTGNTSAKLTLSPSLYTGDGVSLVAIPIGGVGAASSGRLTLSPGDEVKFRIMPILNQSTVFVRPPR